MLPNPDHLCEKEKEKERERDWRAPSREARNYKCLLCSYAERNALGSYLQLGICQSFEAWRFPAITDQPPANF